MAKPDVRWNLTWQIRYRRETTVQKGLRSEEVIENFGFVNISSGNTRWVTLIRRNVQVRDSRCLYAPRPDRDLRRRQKRRTERREFVNQMSRSVVRYKRSADRRREVTLFRNNTNEDLVAPEGCNLKAFQAECLALMVERM